MNYAIDIMAGIVLLFFLLAGWRKGFLLSLLGVVRVVLAYGSAYFAGRYLGYWLGGWANRPRIVTIPMMAGLAFILVTFAFHITMSNLREKHRTKEEKEDYAHPWYSSLAGGGINLAAGLFSLILLFWLGDLFLVGISGHALPGSSKSHFARLARRTVYECINASIARKGRESQAAAMARVASNPEQGMVHLKRVLGADSVQQLLRDRQFAEDLLSGDAARIEANPSLQTLFNDRATLGEMRDLGIFSGKEKKSELCERLSRFGANETIQTSLQNLKAKDLLHTDQILNLVRDRDFDAIVAEVLK